MNAAQLRALVRLWNVTQQHRGTSGGRVCAHVLLGLYNGPRFPLDLTELRLLDPDLLHDALEVIGADSARCVREVHQWLNVVTGRHDFGQRFERLAHDWKIKGRCKVADLEDVAPSFLVVEITPQVAA